jgi:hypothetical protein
VFIGTSLSEGKSVPGNSIETFEYKHLALYKWNLGTGKKNKSVHSSDQTSNFSDLEAAAFSTRPSGPKDTTYKKLLILYLFEQFPIAVLGGSKIQRRQLLCWHSRCDYWPFNIAWPQREYAKTRGKHYNEV